VIGAVDDEHFMRMALREAERAFAEDEVVRGRARGGCFRALARVGEALGPAEEIEEAVVARESPGIAARAAVLVLAVPHEAVQAQPEAVAEHQEFG